MPLFSTGFLEPSTAFEKPPPSCPVKCFAVVNDVDIHYFSARKGASKAASEGDLMFRFQQS